ncbi:MAG TPA: hypothetical protein DCQ29_00405 [Chitinophagaceae bacterium]|nr:hypothetical protein [Chitinophagaceae bacterium]
MKPLYLTLMLLGLFMFQANAQNGLVADQNPNYMVSQAKYTKMADSLTANMGTTVHNTYKAFDWYEAREERRTERRNQRNQRRLMRAQNMGWNQWDNGWNNPWNNRWNNNWGWNNRWSNNFWPNIGFRTGNWWFGW